MPITKAETDTIKAYDAIAEARRGTVTTNIDFWKDHFLNLVSEKGFRRFLDLGCGDGREAALFQSIFGHLGGYVGLDLSRGMLNSTKSRDLKNPSLIEGDIYSLPVAGESVEIVWAPASLIHTPREQIQEQLGEIKRCLSPEGKAFFAMKYGEGEKWEVGRTPEDKRHVVFWDVANFWEELEKAGFFVNYIGIDSVRDARGVTWLYAVATKRLNRNPLFRPQT